MVFNFRFFNRRLRKQSKMSKSTGGNGTARVDAPSLRHGIAPLFLQMADMRADRASCRSNKPHTDSFCTNFYSQALQKIFAKHSRNRSSRCPKGRWSGTQPNRSDPIADGLRVCRTSFLPKEQAIQGRNLFQTERHKLHSSSSCS